MQAMNNQCAKFKTKPLEYLELMERVYFGIVVTGKHAWTPTELRDDDVAAAIAIEDSGMGPFNAGTPPQLAMILSGRTWWIVPCSTDGSANAKRCKRPVPSIVASSMDNLVEAVNKQSRELKIMQYVVTRKGENTVGDCLVRLMSTPGLELGSKLFSFACGIMDSPDNRDLIMSLS